MIDWPARMVERLELFKHVGYDFDSAWEQALAEIPPRGRDLSPREPRLFGDEPGLVEFTRRACDDAWHGRRPKLRFFGGFGDVDPTARRP